MKLTNLEKLNLLMLTDLHEKLGVGTMNTELIRDAISTDNTWALAWELPVEDGDDHPMPHEVNEVMDILNMWSLIEEAYEKLDPIQQATVRAASGQEDEDSLRFAGFDFSDEPEQLSITLFLVKHMMRFRNFKEHDLASESPYLEDYRRMLDAWGHDRRSGAWEWCARPRRTPFSEAELIDVFNGVPLGPLYT